MSMNYSIDIQINSWKHKIMKTSFLCSLYNVDDPDPVLHACGQ